jgi:hypothetical protein
VDPLGSLELGQLLMLLVGMVACAAFVAVLAFGYIVLARRSRGKRSGSNGAVHSQVSALTDDLSGRQDLMTRASSPPSAATGDEYPRLDVEAGLEGTDRKAWVTKESAQISELPAAKVAEILRVVQEPGGGRVWITVTGVRYLALNDIGDRAVGETVLAAITHALRFSNGLVATDKGIVAFALPATDAVEVPAALVALSDIDEPGEVMRLTGDVEGRAFWVTVADHHYRNLAEVSDEVIGHRILEGISRLLQFSRGRLSTDVGVAALPVPSLKVEASGLSIARSGASRSPSATAPSAAPTPTPEQEEAFLRQLMEQNEQPAEKPSRRPGLFGRRGQPQDSAAESPPSFSLVDEIDRIFQAKLAASPLNGTDAQIVASADSGVGIRIGATYYSSPEQVRDPVLRQLIEDSIAEW